MDELVHDLHEEIKQSAPESTPIEVYPANAEEARLIEALSRQAAGKDEGEV